MRGREGSRVGSLIASALVIAACSLPATAAAKPGDLYVTEFGADRIVRVKPATGKVKPVSEPSDDVDTASYVSFMADGRLAFTDEASSSVFAVDRTGGEPTLIADDKFEGPYGIASDPRGRLIVSAYSGTQGVFRVIPATGAVTDMAANNWSSSPYGVAIDPHDSGTIYVLQNVGGIETLSPGGDWTSLDTDPALPSGMWGLARAPDGTLYATNSSEEVLWRINPNSGAAKIVAEDIGNSLGVAVAPNGMLYTSNAGGDEINRVNPKTGKVTPIADDISFPIGIAVEPPRCKGRLAMISGSIGADRLRGSDFGDVLAGLAGDDRIVGFNGPDRACGGPGDDTIDVRGGGKDRVDCGPGTDEVKADGRDLVAGDCEDVNR